MHTRIHSVSVGHTCYNNGMLHTRGPGSMSEEGRNDGVEVDLVSRYDGYHLYLTTAKDKLGI